MKLGLIQGRLSKPIEGYQDTPVDWRSEFDRMKIIGLTHMEWVVTSRSFSNNPIFFENVTSYPIYSICADNLVSSLIDNKNFLQHNLYPICEAALKNNIEYVTIPLLEASSLECDHKLDIFCKLFQTICKKYHKLKFSLETELAINKIPKLLNISDNIRLTYDTGNSTAYGIDHKLYISKFSNVINNVHLKDREFSGASVTPATGDTDFDLIFSLLNDHKYSSIYTLQTAREEAGKEEQTISRHCNILRSIYAKQK